MILQGSARPVVRSELYEELQARIYDHVPPILVCNVIHLIRLCPHGQSLIRCIVYIEPDVPHSLVLRKGLYS